MFVGNGLSLSESRSLWPFMPLKLPSETLSLSGDLYPECWECCDLCCAASSGGADCGADGRDDGAHVFVSLCGRVRGSLKEIIKITIRRIL